MMSFQRGGFFGLVLLASAIPAGAQENLDLGKTPAQLYASNCAICHKSPQGLTEKAGVFGLANFLREHYTASRESAAAIAAYVQSVDKGPPAAKRPPERKAKKKDKSDDKAKADKPADNKPAESSTEKPKADASRSAKGKDEKSGNKPE